MRRRSFGGHRALLFAAVMAVTVSLAGCAPVGSAVPPLASGSATAAPIGPVVASSLHPVPDVPLSPEVAKSETERVAAEVIASLDPALVVNVQQKARLEPAEDSEGYYAIILTISLTPDTNPILVAQAISTTLLDAGWTRFNASTDNGKYETAMSSNPEDGGWFTLITGDASAAKQSVVTMKLASPNLY